MQSKKYITGSLMLLLLAACSKDKRYDVKGDAEVKFFTNSVALGNAPQNSISFQVVNYPDPAGSGFLNLNTSLPEAVKFPVYATREVSQSVVVAAELDNQLVTTYNQQNGTEYEILPDGILTPGTLAASFVQGSSISSDSISIPVSLNSIHTLEARSYMAAVRLTTVSNSSAGALTANTDATITYIVLNVERRWIRSLGVEADVTGTMAPDRSAWVATLTPSPSPAGSILDGSTSSYSRFPSSPGTVDIDMQEVVELGGFRVRFGSSSTTTPTMTDVQISTDGINYQSIGAPERGDLTYSSLYTYYIFYRTIEARYLRLVLNYSTSTSSQNRRVTELDAYIN